MVLHKNGSFNERATGNWPGNCELRFPRFPPMFRSCERGNLISQSSFDHFDIEGIVSSFCSTLFGNTDIYLFPWVHHCPLQTPTTRRSSTSPAKVLPVSPPSPTPPFAFPSGYTVDRRSPTVILRIHYVVWSVALTLPPYEAVPCLLLLFPIIS